MFALMLLGYSFNLYMVFASEQNPPINWGYARTLVGFFHMLRRGQYERIVPMNVFENPGAYGIALKSYFSGLSGQFTTGISLLGLGSLLVFIPPDRVMRRWIMSVVIIFLAYSPCLMIFLNTQYDIQTLFIIRVYSYTVFAMLIGYGLMGILMLKRTY